jgi:1-deoxy-D-xylulose-5-phosphate reductoisomerase
VAILGSTGSIGTTALDLIARFEDRFSVTALAAGRRVAELKDQIARFHPQLVSVADPGEAAKLTGALGADGPRVVSGADGLSAVATADGTDMLLSALVGAVGLQPTLAALDAGIDVGLANKESMVVGGELMRTRATASGASILPVDSEHNAIFQALQGHSREHLRRIVLTASGGPFRGHSEADLATVTRAQALKHPTWDMGAKITIDSATLMNKGLEVIEARWFFEVEPDEIDVVVHPQSIVHSMVEYQDGSVIAVMAIPDMTIPVGHVLAYPDLLDLGYLPHLDLAAAGKLEFFAPDPKTFSCLSLAYGALRAGGTMPAVANAANEIAVERFLADDIEFLDIPRIIDGAMCGHEPARYETVDELLAADSWARAHAREFRPRNRSAEA